MGMYNDVMKERQSSMQIVRGIVASKGWKTQAVNFIARTKPVNQEAWNKKIEMREVPK